MERIEWLLRLYMRTHIRPCPEDFNRQLQQNHVFLALYWTNQEHLFRRFQEEEIDLEALMLMTRQDFSDMNATPL